MKKAKWMFFTISIIIMTSSLYSQFGVGSFSERANSFGWVVWFVSGVTFSTAGIGIILFGSMALALREIALNTRKTEATDAEKKETYSIIMSLAPVFKLIGILLIIYGWVWPIIIRFLI